jgi:hypothetical protein
MSVEEIDKRVVQGFHTCRLMMFEGVERDIQWQTSAASNPLVEEL